MITMIDEIYDRNYQAARDQLNADFAGFLAKLRSAIAPALSAVHRFEWDAPWNITVGPKART